MRSPSISSARQPFFTSQTSTSSSRYSMASSSADSGERLYSRQTPYSSAQQRSGGLPSDAHQPWGTTAEVFHEGSIAEDDDHLYLPDKQDGVQHDYFSLRGLANFLTLGLLLCGLLLLFAGYPIITYVREHAPRSNGAFNLGGINASGQVPEVVGNFGLIDSDTPEEARSIVTQKGETWELVFSDEFNTPGRTFWPGDDPYWEALDLAPWATKDLQYYSPQAVTTVEDPDDATNGFLRFTLSNITQHDRYFEGAEISSWNKFCMTGGRLEVSARLPGRPDVYGLWPAAWAMGNLGRVGYGGTLEGVWPYTYDSCDSGTLPNQTRPDGTPTSLATGNNWGEPLSFLSGQRLSACTCPDDETHPGPRKADGTFVGRSAPEIDLIEAQIDPVTRIGHVSQSGQWAPFNLGYLWPNETSAHFYNPEMTELNGWQGNNMQQSTSGVSLTNPKCYDEFSMITIFSSHPAADNPLWRLSQMPAGGGTHTGCFSMYAFDYTPGLDGDITWFTDGKPAWTVEASAMGARPEIDISARPVPMEPMYLIMNLAISEGFSQIDWEGLAELYPVHYDIDYVRVYQDPDRINIGCDPVDFPTQAYIDRYPEGYTTYNITTWDQMTDSAPQPKNRLVDTC